MKRIIIALMAVFFTGLAYGQDETGYGFEVGIKAGANNTWIVINNDLQNNHHTNENFMVKPFAGISVGYKFNEYTSLMTECFWSKQGANFKLLDKNSGGNVIGEKKMKLNYLVVPLLIKRTSEGTTRFALQFGGQVAFLLKGNEENTFDEDVIVYDTWNKLPHPFIKGTYPLATTDEDKQVNGVGSFNKTDFNVVADIGLEHDLSKSCYFSAGLRLVYGFRDVRTGQTQVSVYDIDKYTLRYNVTGGINFGLHWFLGSDSNGDDYKVKTKVKP